jgi:hypothetical protein
MNLPVSLTGELIIEPTVDQECSAHVITRRNGDLYGAWLDDTTENAEHGLDYYVTLAVAKYGPQGLTVIVCVPPGEPHLHHGPQPPVINAYERYVYGMLDAPPAAWGPCPRNYGAYVVQQRWKGTRGLRAPSPAQRRRLLTEVEAIAPDRDLIFLF